MYTIFLCPFALETDVNKVKTKFLYEGEREVTTVFYHGFKFVIHAIWLGLQTIVIAAAAVGVWYLGVEAWIVSLATFAMWLVTIFPRLLRALIDWRFDFILVTTDKVVLIDQASIFHQRVTPINLENFASVSTETQFWNLFPFGKLRFHLKSGIGADLMLSYIARADEVAARIANTVTEFQRRKDLRRFGEQGQGGGAATDGQ